MREPRPNHNPPGPRPNQMAEDSRSFPEMLQLLYSETYTGTVVLKFRGGRPHCLIRRGVVTLLLK